MNLVTKAKNSKAVATNQRQHHNKKNRNLQTYFIVTPFGPPFEVKVTSGLCQPTKKYIKKTWRKQHGIFSDSMDNEQRQHSTEYARSFDSFVGVLRGFEICGLMYRVRQSINKCTGVFGFYHLTISMSLHTVAGGWLSFKHPFSPSTPTQLQCSDHFVLINRLTFMKFLPTSFRFMSFIQLIIIKKIRSLFQPWAFLSNLSLLVLLAAVFIVVYFCVRMFLKCIHRFFCVCLIPSSLLTLILQSSFIFVIKLRATTTIRMQHISP